MDLQGEDAAKVCKRCNARNVVVKVRSLTLCSECFVRFIWNKSVRRLDACQRELSEAGITSSRHAVGLSLGASSAALLHIVEDHVRYQLAKRRRKLDVVVIYVDADPTSSATCLATQELLQRYQERYPTFEFHARPLSDALQLSTIDWPALPPVPDAATPHARLLAFLNGLPSTSSRADTQNVLTRHLLASTALEHGCQALFLGHSTTALAELTLAQTAKGRGFALPWLITDGTAHFKTFPPSDGSATPTAVPEAGLPANLPDAGGTSSSSPVSNLPIYFPMREHFRRELGSYAKHTIPPLVDLVADGNASWASRAAVVSHKDISIDEVMLRYFEDVERSYPSVVANVVRTTAKLERLEAAALCGLCSMPLDVLGDERWRGEIGESEVGAGRNAGVGKLCHGCLRSVYG